MKGLDFSALQMPLWALAKSQVLKLREPTFLPSSLQLHFEYEAFPWFPTMLYIRITGNSLKPNAQVAPHSTEVTLSGGRGTRHQ